MADRLGQQLGNYRLVRLLGQGGFADVYLGQHIHLDSQAAIKVLQVRLTGSALEQFRGEGRALARLLHPNIVRVFDFGVENDTPFLVMDFAPNGSLRHHYPKGTILSPATILPHLTQVARALQYAHDRKLIHRDVKPENMLLGPTNEVLLSDFGLVLHAQSTASQTTKEMAGTLPYMAPEQINGKPRPASDQYALGIVLYELLSGDRPFHGSLLEIATQHLMTPPAPLYGKVPGMTRALQEVVFTALAKDFQQRFANMEAFATAFEQACRAAPRSSLSLASGADSLQQTPLPPSASNIGLQGQSQQLPSLETFSGESQQPTYIHPLASQSQQSPLITTPLDLSHPTSGNPTGNSLQEPTVMISSANPLLTPPPTPFGSSSLDPRLTPPSSSPLTLLNEIPAASPRQREMLTLPVPSLHQPAGVSPSPGRGTPDTVDGAASKGNRQGYPAVPARSAEQKVPRKTSKRVLVLVLVLLAVTLVGGGIASAIPGPFHTWLGHLADLAGGVSSATVTLTPTSTDLKKTYAIPLVTGRPDASQHQVQARLLSVITQPRSETVQASGILPAVRATGMLTFINTSSVVETTAPLTGFGGDDGVVVELYQTVSVPAGMTVTAPAYANNPGTSGNIKAYDINFDLHNRISSCTNPQAGGLLICNKAAFAGGRDASPQVQQRDITGATNDLEAANTPDPQHVFQDQIHANERLIGTPSCRPNVNPDHAAGDQATSVTVTVSFTCTGEVYDHDGALTIATQWLKQDAIQAPGIGYALVGNVVLTQTQPAHWDANQGTGTVSVNAEGVWVFQFSEAQKQQLARLVAGKSTSDAQSILQGQQGVKQADIQLSDGNSSILPGDPGQITIFVKRVAGSR